MKYKISGINFFNFKGGYDNSVKFNVFTGNIWKRNEFIKFQ